MNEGEIMFINQLPSLLIADMGKDGITYGTKLRYQHEEILWDKVNEIIEVLNSFSQEVSMAKKESGVVKK